MLQTIIDACQFKQEALDYALSRQVEDLRDLQKHDATAARDFFERTYVTDGMAQLLRQGLQRLAGMSDQAAFELRQAMGGGKTHSMLALGYLAAHPEVAGADLAKVTEGFTLQPSRVVVISGRNINHDHFLWGEIADQLGKPDLFARFWRNGARAPNEDDWIELLGDQPVLMLFDELPPYLENAVTITVGAGTLGDVTSAAISNLLSAAIKLPRVCIVLSTLVGQYKASGDLSRIMSQITNEARRQAKPITPVELGSDEIYHILRKRLLAREPAPAVIESVAEAFGQVLSDAVKSKTLERAAEKIADEVAATYPFHPSLKTVVATFKDNEGFRQTRGLMTIAALMIKSVQKRKINDVYLIGPQHLDLADRGIRDMVNNIYDLDAAISVDIVDTGASDAHAELIDADAGNDSAMQTARLILMASLAESSDAVKGLQPADILSFLVAPLRAENEFVAALEGLIARSWYLHKRDNGAWYFSKNENLTKKIENLARNAPPHKIEQDLSRRLDEIFTTRRRTAYARVHAMPKVEDLSTRGDRALIVLSPDAKMPPEKAQQLFAATAERNNFAIVSGEGLDLASVEERLRTAYAIAKVLDQEGQASANRPDLEARQVDAELDVYQTIASTLNKIWYPGREPGGRESLLGATLKLDSFRRDGGAGYDGETAVENALTATGSRKLVLDVEANFEMLADRAEEMLWPASGRVTTWGDVTDRAIGNVRWLWLPRNGLEDLRRLAISRQRWRENGNGGIEKGPFEKEKTSVGVTEAAYDDHTGVATLNVLARNAGRRARIYWSTTADISSSSERLEAPRMETSEMRIYFLAVDPDGDHETGEPFVWTNRLNLTHDPRAAGTGYEVSLTVVPNGQIRWNTDATSARDGALYGGPIKLDGQQDVVIYAFAEAGSITTTREFRIPRREGDGVKIDVSRPGRVRKQINLTTTDKVFAAIAKAKEARARFRNVMVTVGSGSRAVSTHFGSDFEVSAEAIERLAKYARQELTDDNAEITVTWRIVDVDRAGDLDQLMSAIGEVLSAGEIEQN
jgi:transposase